MPKVTDEAKTVCMEIHLKYKRNFLKLANHFLPLTETFKSACKNILKLICGHIPLITLK